MALAFAPKPFSGLFRCAYLEKPAPRWKKLPAFPVPSASVSDTLRNINASELGKLFAHGMEDNMDKQQFSKLIPV